MSVDLSDPKSFQDIGARKEFAPADRSVSAARHCPRFNS
jgi:hypothetical protein